MKAAVYTRYGPPEVMTVEEVPVPRPADDEVLVKVSAASVNSWDWDLLTGQPVVYRMFGLFKPKLRTIGADIAGRVETVGKHVTRFRSGDDVLGDLSASGWGGFAEYVTAKESALVRKPKDLSFSDAAAIPQAGVMALQGLRDQRPMRAGDTVLFNGGGGGVGTIGIQIAKSMGLHVTAVDRGEKLELMASLGAERVIDYTKEDYTKQGFSFDLILDVAAAYSVSVYRSLLRPGGVYAMIGGVPSVAIPLVIFGGLRSKGKDRKVGVLMHEPNKNLSELAKMATEGAFKAVIDRSYPLEDIAEAMRYFGTGAVKGKIIISMDRT